MLQQPKWDNKIQLKFGVNKICHIAPSILIQCPNTAERRFKQAA
jgi:hypothetical protein